METPDLASPFVAHLLRYSLSTPAASCRRGLGTEETLLETVRQMLHAGWLRPLRPLFGDTLGLELSDSAYRGVYGDEARAPQLSGLSLYRAYATLHACCLGQCLRHRVLPAELQIQFPPLWQPGLPCSDYYATVDTERTRLGLFQIDCGYLPIRIVRRAHDRITRRRQIPAFRRRIDAGDFEITVLTATPQKGDLLLEAFQARPLPVPLQVEVIAELVALQEDLPARRRKQEDDPALNAH